MDGLDCLDELSLALRNVLEVFDGFYSIPISPCKVNATEDWTAIG